MQTFNDLIKYRQSVQEIPVHPSQIQNIEERRIQASRAAARLQLIKPQIDEEALAVAQAFADRPDIPQLDVITRHDYRNIHRRYAAHPCNTAGFITPLATRRAQARIDRVILKNSFKAWDLGVSSSYYEGANEHMSHYGEHYVLGTQGELYGVQCSYSDELQPLQSDTVHVVEHIPAQGYDHNYEDRLLIARNGLANIVCQYEVSIAI